MIFYKSINLIVVLNDKIGFLKMYKTIIYLINLFKIIELLKVIKCS